MSFFLDTNGESELTRSNRRAGGAHNAGPRHVHTHVDNPEHIIRLQNGTYVAADHEGRPYQDAQGNFQAYADPTTFSGAEREAAMRDPHSQSQRHYAPDADETASIRAQLVAKYGPDVAAPEGSGAYDVGHL